MKAIRIIANGIELDYVHDTLTINRENNAFINDFKVSHSSFPFLIIENQKALQALGQRNIASLGKKKVVDVTVIEAGQKYSGQLATLNYINGFRKVDLKYGTAALSILDKKLSGLLPVVSVIPGENTPVPYSETALEVVPGHEQFPAYANAQLGKIFPEVNFTFPMMSWKDKFGEDLETDHEWYLYDNNYNYFRNNGTFAPNFYNVVGDAVVVANVNVPSPQLFALGVLKMAFQGIGWTIAGNFVNSPFAHRLVVLSTKDNLCKVNVGSAPQFFDFDDFTDVGGAFDYNFFVEIFYPSSAGEYYLNYYADEPLRGPVSNGLPFSILQVRQEGQTSVIYKNYNDPLNYSGQFTFTVAPGNEGNPIYVQWGRNVATTTQPPDLLSFSWGMVGKDFNMMHPTIELGRYAPDWSLAEFINELKIKFCLDITFDDLAQVATFNFASDLLTAPAKFVTGKKLVADDYAPPANVGITFKGPQDDDYIIVTPQGITLNDAPESEYIEIIESKFKTVPRTSVTADLAAAEDKDGVGLMIYDPSEPAEPGTGLRPYISADYNGYTVAIPGARGTYATYWANVAHMKLNGSTLTMQGPFTGQEVRQLQQLQKLHANNQEYIILGVELKPTLQDNNQVKFSLQSVNF